MGLIQSGIGLISGLNISDIVDKLMKVNAQSRDALSTRNDDLKKQQTAYTELMALLYSVKYISDNLGKESLFAKTTATSSDAGVISVKTTGTPVIGTYQFTALRKAQSQQLLSSGFESSRDTLGSGTISFRFGGTVQHAIELSDINGGAGFSAGAVLITDRSGARAQIDLTAARSLSDVVDAINNNGGVNLTAEIVGDAIRLSDHTGETVSNLKVQEVGGGGTAASLGLAGINAASPTATGQDIVYLSRGMYLDALNDGLGVRADTVFADIHYTLRDGTVGDIDLSPMQSGSATVLKERTLGELMDKINAAQPGKLKIEIAPDGRRLVLTDLTAGANSFAVTSIHDSKVLEDLGLTGPAVGGVIAGRRVLAGGATVLLSSLNGGKGLGQLGTISLTDRAGSSALVDLDQAETLEDVIDAINAAPVQIEARVNQAKNGIELVDISGSSGGNLIVANADATGTADKLKIAVDGAVSRVNGGDLRLQIIGVNTKLARLNGGAGVAQGMFRITDSTGAVGAITVTGSMQTVGDVLTAINASAANVLAEINDTGDGIVIRDANDGAARLKIENLYGSSTAQDLNLLGAPKSIEENGRTTQIIDGAMTRTIDLAAQDPQAITLDTKLSELNHGSGVARSKFIITNSNGASATVDLGKSGITTVGDLLKEINSLSLNVTASIDETGDGIAIYDANGGTGTLSVAELGATTAKDLNILGSAASVIKNGVPTQVIDGSTSLKPIPYTLEKLRDKINQLNAGVTASIFNDGSNQPYRLSLVGNRTGRAGEMLLDASQTGISFTEIAKAQDALLATGGAAANAARVLVASNTNDFSKVLTGATLTIENASSKPVTVKVATSDSDILANLKTFVDNYNKFRSKLNEDTKYDATSDTKSVLTGDNAAFQLDTEMSNLLSGVFLGVGSLQSLAAVGININSDGTIALDESKLDYALSTRRDDVEKLFTTPVTGVSARFAKVIERLAGPATSLLELRNQALQDTYDRNQTRIDNMTAQLDNQRNRLLMQFYQMELNLAKIQSSLNALTSIEWMLGNNSNNSLFSSSSS